MHLKWAGSGLAVASASFTQTRSFSPYSSFSLQVGQGASASALLELITPGLARGALDEAQALVRLHLGVPGTPILSKFRYPVAIIDFSTDWELLHGALMGCCLSAFTGTVWLAVACSVSRPG